MDGNLGLTCDASYIITNLWSIYIPQTQHNIISLLSRNNQNRRAAKRHQDRKKTRNYQDIQYKICI